MNTSWTNRWDERYSLDEYAYGMAPNKYFEEQTRKLPSGAILFPAEGEGRNAVFAATLGWSVSAFDISNAGRAKALKLAADNKVTIDYQVGELPSLPYTQGQFDAMALIYAHFPADIKSNYHKMLDKLLRKGAVVIFEAFSKKHLAYNAKNEKVGGPKDIGSLFSIEEIQHDFSNYSFRELAEVEIELHEGAFHNGKGSVIRFVAVKQ